jgi:hypothetical protein
MAAKARGRMMTCWKCGVSIEVRDRVGFRDLCPKCDRPQHACLNCKFYDKSFNNECREPMSDRVVDKERFNFCEYFTPSARPRSAATVASPSRAQLDALFRKPK